MNIFDILIVQPIFNLLIVIYGILPGGDFGVAIIIFTILVRCAMWPLVKKQLHQVKVQRALQPQLERIKQQAKGNKQLKQQLMLELYREKGINPLGGIGTLLLQFPIFIALYNVINIVTRTPEKIEQYTYAFVQTLPSVDALVSSAAHTFNESLFGVIDLSKTALNNGVIYWPLLFLALLAACLQYVQATQIAPKLTEKKRLRDILADSSKGKEVDQTEVTAIMMNRINRFLPIVTFTVMIALPGAIALYTVVGSIVAIIQQYIILRNDVNDMETLVEDKQTTRGNTRGQQRADAAIEAEIVTIAPKSKKKGTKREKM